jgi:hypothetical protein
VIRDLEQGTDVSLGNVGEFAWSDDGSTLAMTIDVDGKTGNGVQVLNAATGAIRSLDASDNTYSNLVWRSHSDDLVALRSHIDSAYVDTAYAVLTWRDAASARPSLSIFDYTTNAQRCASRHIAGRNGRTTAASFMWVSRRANRAARLSGAPARSRRACRCGTGKICVSSISSRCRRCRTGSARSSPRCTWHRTSWCAGGRRGGQRRAVRQPARRAGDR